MKEGVNKIVSIVLAFLVVMATTTVATDMHWCCNTLVDWSIRGEAELCEGEFQASGQSDMQCSIGAEDCCKNLSSLKKGEQIVDTAPETQPEFPGLELHLPHHISQIETSKQHSCIPFNTYNPPLLIRDLLVLHETFLI